jgi:hypothetical protein
MIEWTCEFRSGKLGSDWCMPYLIQLYATRNMIEALNEEWFTEYALTLTFNFTIPNMQTTHVISYLFMDQ